MGKQPQGSGGECVKVVVRCRPLNSKEKQDGRTQIVNMNVREGQVAVTDPNAAGSERPKIYTFDQVYDWNSTQKEVFSISARPIIDATINGYNGTIFAYGQTGTGKSHTMEGKDEPEELQGIMLRAFNHIFETIQEQAGTTEFLVRASYLEIYNEEVRDLLGKPDQNLQVKENPDKGVYVKDLKQVIVKNGKELDQVLTVGKKNRSVGFTEMNKDSSRSHSILTITIECTEAVEGDSRIRVGKLNLVDLAGSERASKTGAQGDRLKEGIKINLSLTALGNVISALVDGKSGHVPYRDSKLTRLLQDSLGGNTKTCMVANVGPADWNYDETLSTLRYANRAKNIKNAPKINEDPKDAMLREFQDEILRLKKALEEKQGGKPAKAKSAGAKSSRKTGPNVDKINQIRDEARQKLIESMTVRGAMDQNDGVVAKIKEEAEQKARAQLESMLAEKSATEEQKKQIQEALEQQKAEIDAIAQEAEKEQKERETLEQQLSAMESKLVSGGNTLMRKMQKLERKAEAVNEELEVKRRQEEEQQRRLRELEMANDDLETKYASLEDEMNAKGKKLREMYKQYKQKQSELQDIQKEFQREREQILSDIREMTQDLKLKDLIIDYFIPHDYQILIMEQRSFREVDNQWEFEHMDYAGNCIVDIQSHEEWRSKQRSDTSNNESQLNQVYFSYKAMAEDLGFGSNQNRSSRPQSAGQRRSGQGNRPPSSRRSKSSLKGPTDIVSLGGTAKRLQQEAEEGLKESFPVARGLVQDPTFVRRPSRQATDS